MVVDTDVHFQESIGRLADYFDEPWKSRILDHNDQSYAEKVFLPGRSGDRLLGGKIQRDTDYPGEEMKPEEIPTAMEKLGVEEVILISNVMLSFSRVKADDERSVILANAYMEFMIEEVTDPAEGIYTLIVAPYQEPDEAINLIERYGDDPGVVGVCMITAGAEPPLGNRRYEPIYEVCESNGLPVVFHSGGGGLDEYYLSGYEKLLETHTLGFLNANMSQITSLIVQGIPEKFPDLDIIFQESGIFWVPSLMYRLDAEYMKRPSEAPMLEKKPSQYMKEFYYGTQPLEHPNEEKYLEYTIEMLGGPDRLMYASDYPHWDYDHPSAIRDISYLSAEEQNNVLAGNAKEVFDI